MFYLVCLTAEICLRMNHHILNISLHPTSDNAVINSSNYICNDRGEMFSK